MKPIVFHPESLAEAHETTLWYHAITLGLGDDFAIELRATVERIRANPLLYAMHSATFRIAPLRRFPYGVMYEDQPDRIWVAAVMHHSRKPGYWSHRLEP